MTPTINLDSAKRSIALPEEKPCYLQIAETIVALWKAICDWICSWFSKPEANLNDISRRSPDAFFHIMHYLLPEEVGRCETVCKSWKIPDQVWKTQCEQEHVSYKLPEEKHKRAFSHPRPPSLAFGVGAWKKYFGDPGVAPRLPGSIHRTFPKLKDTHTLTLIPAKVDGKPLCINTFIPLAKKCSVEILSATVIQNEYGNGAEEKSIWVWMQKNIEPESAGITQAEAEQQYHPLGKTLWITVSTVAHFARFEITLFPKSSLYLTRTSESFQSKSGPVCVTVGAFQRKTLLISPGGGSKDNIGVARAYLA